MFPDIIKCGGCGGNVELGPMRHEALCCPACSGVGNARIRELEAENRVLKMALADAVADSMDTDENGLYDVEECEQVIQLWLDGAEKREAGR